MKHFLASLLAALLLLSCCACASPTPAADDRDDNPLLLDESPSNEEDAYIPDDAPPPDDNAPPDTNASQDNTNGENALPENGSYTTKEDVAAYLNTYGHLPDNFITKKEAQDLGWTGGSLEPYAPGKCIGGSHFGNYEGLLPEDHSYSECDIDTLGADSRGAKRIVYSDDGLIYYTGDHYKSFELLYGEE